LDNVLHYMDPFFGNGTIDLPQPRGIAATWFFIKAQTGNTHPGACVPFGMISACAYSGAYVTGYGLNAPNTHGSPPQRFDAYTATGFAHLHHSGTGAIDTYYNYLRVTPLVRALEGLGTRWQLEDEVAHPGFYAATLTGAGIRAELTASPRAALHRYTFSEGDHGRLAVDVSAGGIDYPRMRTRPTAAAIEVCSGSAAQGWVTMAGVTIYFYLETDAPDSTCTLWVDKQATAVCSLSFDRIDEDDERAFGLLFDGPSPLLFRVGLSLRGTAQARRNAHTVVGRSFEQVAAEAAQAWADSARRIQVDGGSEAQRTVFYSSLYHSLVKPADWHGESPYWVEDACYLDFATMWDQYKTQLPLLLTLYPERGRDIVNTLLALAEHMGGFPNAFILNADLTGFDGQARALAHHTIADAYYRHIDGVDWQRALERMERDLRRSRNDDFIARGLVYPVTHTLDLAAACFCTAQIAKGLGDEDCYEEMMALSGRWRAAYDSETGKLIEARYYEGGLWNYSFRLLHDMAGRIALYPSEAAFVAELDRFFGYGQPPVAQPTDPADREVMAWGHALNRFEGYNNEPDIETPYAYLYAGRPDRVAEVVRAGMRYLYTTGRGGLPGNNDSGGLTSCYLWNAIGLFPVTGQPVFLIGSPLFPRAVLELPGGPFTVEAPDTSTENIYVQRARLNGLPNERAYLTVDEVLRGGTLELDMGAQPSDWGRQERPPSFPPA
jgi:predicted alpha-1,2-mannosidase